ncbi:MAG TPA: GAF domain-containing sensor histidine kinase [Thermoanaerobaculia bacterium]|jgi:signal transduction histidine kinase
MLAPPIPRDEAARLRALEMLRILDTAPEAPYDDLTRLAAAICQTPIALVTLVDSSRQWFKSRMGLCVSETPRDVAFCAHAIAEDDVFIVRDATVDPRFHDNPLALGEPYIRFYAGVPLVTAAGYKLGTLCVIDCVPRELTELQLDALRGLARQVVNQFELRERLYEVERMKSEFVATISHELRTPLTSIRGSLGLLASGAIGELTGEARKMIGIAERNSVRLISLINDILDFDSLENGTLELDLRPTPAARLIERSVAQVRPLAAQEQVELHTVSADGILLADEYRLGQALVKLLTNAVQFSPRGATVTLRTVVNGGSVELRVEDLGRGISPAARTKLFHPFQQIDSSASRRQGGAGLGLAICKAIVEQHGGTIGVESAEGEGSTFWLRLPAVASVTVAAATR